MTTPATGVSERNSSPTAVREEVATSERFREELKQIPTVNHQVYGTCLGATEDGTERNLGADAGL
jgi:hypothetical protein